MAFYNRGPTTEAFLPWASSDFEPQYEAAACAADEYLKHTFVEVTILLHGSNPRVLSLSVPKALTCADLKGQLAVEGVVSTCGGLEVALDEASDAISDETTLELSEGQVVHLRRAAKLVSITALATGGGQRSEDEVYELVVPGETTGLLLRLAIEQATGGSLRPAAVFLAEAGCEDAAHAIGDEESIVLQDEQAVIVQREAAIEPEQPVTAAIPPKVAVEVPAQGKGFFSALRARFSRSRGKETAGPVTNLCIKSASNVKITGNTITCTSEKSWSSSVVFDVPDASFFELSVKLLHDAPLAEAEGLVGRWMLGLVPLSASEVKTDADRQRLLQKGYFVTVCHGHPAKMHTPHMAYNGTCGEDLDVLPGELKKGQTLTIRWAAAGSTFSVQVDDCDTITLPYSPSSEEVRPCLVFGGKPAEVNILQLGKELWSGA